MDLEKAADAHTQWRIKFRTAIDAKQSLDDRNIACDDKCELGQWLHGDGRSKHAAKPQFQALVAAHKQFHAVAGRVATTINAGRISDAEAMLAGAFQAQSRETISAIRAARAACT